MQTLSSPYFLLGSIQGNCTISPCSTDLTQLFKLFSSLWGWWHKIVPRHRVLMTYNCYWESLYIMQLQINSLGEPSSYFCFDAALAHVLVMCCLNMRRPSPCMAPWEKLSELTKEHVHVLANSQKKVAQRPCESFLSASLSRCDNSTTQCEGPSVQHLHTYPREFYGYWWTCAQLCSF